MNIIDDNVDESERRFESRYNLLEKVGEGTFGKVYKARHNQTRELVAMKQIKLDVQDQGIPSTAIREIALLKELSHTNVVRILDVFCKPNKLVLVFEWLEKDLNKFMRSCDFHLDCDTVKNLACQLFRGV